MCDNDIHPGLIEDWTVTRRSFVAGGAAAVGIFATAVEAAEANVVEKDVTITTADGAADAALFYPSGKGSWPAVLMWPDILGLRPVFRDMARRLSAQGYVVLVPNPFYRSAKAPVMTGNIDFSNREAMQKLFGYRGAISDAGIDHDAQAFVGFLDKQPQTDKRKGVGTQGYCMGGPFVFRTAALLPNRVRAAATFHGGGLVTKDPNSPHLLIPKTKAAFLCCVAKNDDAKSPTDKDVLKAAFAAAGRPATVEVYGGDHGWTVPGSQVYNQAEAERAWAALTKLYKANLA